MDLVRAVFMWAMPVLACVGIMAFLFSEDGSRLRRAALIVGWGWAAVILIDVLTGWASWNLTAAIGGWLIMFKPYKRHATSSPDSPPVNG